MTFHDVKIQSPGLAGLGTQTFLDEHQVMGLTAIDIHVGLDEPTRVALSMVAALTVYEATADVKYRVATMHTISGTMMYAEGDTPAEAFEALASKLREEAT